MKRFSMIAVLVVAAIATSSAQQNTDRVRALPGDRPAANIHATRSAVFGRNGMIATSQPMASAAGLKVLQEGGNAIDAAVTAAAVLAVVEPSMTGIGGDLFAIVYDAKTKTLHALNASGRSAYAATPQEYAKRGQTRMPGTGVLSVTVPGVVEGWSELLSKYGTLSMAKAVAPAVDYAKNGYAVSEIISGQWKASEKKLAADPVTAATFLPNGHPLQPGEIFTNPHLAATLEAVGKGGRDAFYKGAIARAIVADMRKRDGLLDERDFAEHKADWVDPISTTYRGYEVYEMPPNTQGFVVLEMLNILEGFDVKAMGHNSPEALHALVEAKRIAFADRAAYDGDPASVPASVLKTLISKDYAALRRKEIDPQHAAESYKAGVMPGRPDDGADRRSAPEFHGHGSRRHDLHDGRGRKGQFRLADPVPVLRFRIRRRGRRHRHPAAQPGKRLQSDSRIAGSDRAAQAAAPHADSGVRDEGRQAVVLIRCHGRRPPGAGTYAGAPERDRLRHERAGSGRSRARDARQQRTSRGEQRA